MAIQYDQRITILVKSEDKERYRAACKAQGLDMTGALRPAAMAYIESWEAQQNQPVPPT
jgi:hypothetical protein